MPSVVKATGNTKEDSITNDIDGANGGDKRVEDGKRIDYVVTSMKLWNTLQLDVRRWPEVSI